MPDVANEFDGNAQRTSLYVKGTIAGDTAWPSQLATADPGNVQIPMIAVVGSNGAQFSRIGAAQLITDAAAGAFSLAAVLSLYNGATWDRQRTPSKFNHVLATAAGNTAVWTPAAGKKFRLMRFAVGISGGTLLAVAGIETITFQDSASGINGIRFDVQVPSTVVTGEEYFSGWIDWGNGFLSAVANNVLNVNLGTATTAGGVTVMVAGSEE